MWLLLLQGQQEKGSTSRATALDDVTVSPLPHSINHKEFTHSAFSLGEGIAQSHEHQDVGVTGGLFTQRGLKKAREAVPQPLARALCQAGTASGLRGAE